MVIQSASVNGDSSTTVPLWISGNEEVRSGTFDVYSPALNDVCWKAATATREDAIKAVECAQEAFKSWSKSKLELRSEILLKTAAHLEANAAEYASFIATEMGAGIPVAQFFVLPLAIGMLRDIAGQVFTLCGKVPHCTQDGQSCIIFKEPYGVTLGIVPWNAPYVFGVRSAATAIATGNTTILKASDLTPRCYWAVAKAFYAAGLPAGVLNVLSCPPSHAAEIVNTMIQHPAVRKVNFTGSAAVGRKIARACGEALKPCLMELGGKNSAIVLEDANLELAVQACLAGSFLNAGQICMAADRIIVRRSIAPMFNEAMIKALENLAKESSLSNVVSLASKDRLTRMLCEAIADGANVTFGSNGQQKLPGTAFIPTVLEGVQNSNELWEEESFGPIVALATVESEEDAISLANSTGYGLSASAFTKDLRKGFAIAKRLETGAVHINSMTIHDEPPLPFGGTKNSGWGRFNADEGLQEFLVTKSVTWDD